MCLNTHMWVPVIACGFPCGIAPSLHECRPVYLSFLTEHAKARMSSVSQVQDFKDKHAGVKREGTDGSEVGQEAGTLSPVGQL